MSQKKGTGQLGQDALLNGLTLSTDSFFQDEMEMSEKELAQIKG